MSLMILMTLMNGPIEDDDDVTDAAAADDGNNNGVHFHSVELERTVAMFIKYLA